MRHTRGGPAPARELDTQRDSPADRLHPSSPLRAVTLAVAVHLARTAVILGGVAVLPLLGGWWVGLGVNVLCVVYALAVGAAFGVLRCSGIGRWWGGRHAALILVLPLAEALAWVIPGGPIDEAPGAAWWAVTMLLVGINEEVVNRGVVLDLLARALPAWSAVALTAALFGMQHLSLLITSGRSTTDVLTNVLASACYGFFLSAFQFRYAWLLPLVLVHALADWTTVLSPHPFSDTVIAAICAVYVVAGAWLMAASRQDVRRPSGPRRAGR